MDVGRATRIQAAITGQVRAAPNNVITMPVATAVIAQVAEVASLQTGNPGDTSLLFFNTFRITGGAQANGHAVSTFDMEGTIAPPNAVNMFVLIELGLDDLDEFGAGTVLIPLLLEDQIPAGGNTDRLRFFLYSLFEARLAPGAYRLRVTFFHDGGVQFVYTIDVLRTSWRAI